LGYVNVTEETNEIKSRREKGVLFQSSHFVSNAPHIMIKLRVVIHESKETKYAR
jgi:hypothetical protein